MRSAFIVFFLLFSIFPAGFAPSAHAGLLIIPIPSPVVSPSSLPPTPTPTSLSTPLVLPTPLKAVRAPKPLPSFSPRISPTQSASPSPLPVVAQPVASPAAQPLRYEDAPPIDFAKPTPPEEVKAAATLPFSVTVFGGDNLISFSEINQLVGTTLFSSTIYYGGELGIPLAEDFSLLIRAERLSNNASVESTTFKLQALPVSGGVDYLATKTKSIELHLSALIGVSLGTELTETAAGLPAPNVTQFSDTSFTAMARANLVFPISKLIALDAEAGYRYLKTSTITPSPTGAGGTLFQSGGSYVPTALNLCGPFFGGGLTFSFY